MSVAYAIGERKYAANSRRIRLSSGRMVGIPASSRCGRTSDAFLAGEADEDLFQALILVLLADGRQRPLLDHLPAVDHHDRVARHLHFREDVRAQQDRVLAAELADQLPGLPDL